MDVLLYFILFIAGLLLIIKGSDWFVETTVWFAKLLKIPNIIIGATLVSICTTLPEMLVSTGSALNGNTSMAFGNAAGSVACNTGLIFAIIILFSTPVLTHARALKIKTLFISLTLFVSGIVAFIYGEITRTFGLILFLLTFVFLLFNYFQNRQSKLVDPIVEQVAADRKDIWKNSGLFVQGLGMTIGGAYLMIEYGVRIASFFNVPEIIIGVTMTAFGTSLPELVTAITSIRKKVAALSMGNILGANVLNLTMVMGTAAMINPIPADSNLVFFHIPVILLITLALAAGTWFAYRKYSRLTGAILLSLYATYMAINVIVAF
ncbi:MAG: calcium/sodium antiporter [Clostridia bacterium]